MPTVAMPPPPDCDDQAEIIPPEPFLRTEAGAMPIAELNHDGRILTCNLAARQLVVIGRKFVDYVSAPDRDSLPQRLAQARLGESVAEFDAMIQTDDGWHFVSWTVQPERYRGKPDSAPVLVARGCPCPLERRINLLARLTRLTARERDILELLVDSSPNSRIAQQLGISQSTVKNHLKTIFAKTGVSSRHELAHWLL